MTVPAHSPKKATFNEANENLYEPFQDLSFQKYDLEAPWPEWNDADINKEVWDDMRSKSRTSNDSKTQNIGVINLFEDPDNPNLPLALGLSSVTWKRPDDVFPEESLTLYNPSNGEFQLSILTPDADCELFQSFNQILPILQFFAVRLNFPVEYETSLFVSTTQGEHWKPWHHIYALTKAGKGHVHAPQYCPYGKYVIRIYHMGKWRKITVDDRIPCNRNGICLLPVTQVQGELWPILLMKALLKIENLTPCSYLKLMDFPFLTFFTGWIYSPINSPNKSREQIWRRLWMTLPAYEYPKDSSNTKKILTGRYEQNVFVLAELNFDTDIVYNVGFTMFRSVPLFRAKIKEATRLWKRIRWIYWAHKKGLWIDERKLPPYRRLLGVSYNEEIHHYLTPDPQEEAAMFDIPETETGDLGAEEVPEFWCDFLKFEKHLQEVILYIKPEVFTSSFKITNIRSETPLSLGRSGKIPGNSQNIFFQQPALLPCCNEPPVLYFESANPVFTSFFFSVSPHGFLNNPGYLDADHPEIIRPAVASLVVERFDWKTIKQGEIIGMTKTVGSSNLSLSLKPGRHILKLWIVCEHPFALDIFSDVELHIYKGPKIRNFMSKEADTILQYIENLSNSFIILVSKFGTPQLANGLRSFYDSIKPGNKFSTGYLSMMDKFIETFLNYLLLALKNLIIHAEELRIVMGALQSLFVNLSIRCDLPPTDSNQHVTNTKKNSKKMTPGYPEEVTFAVSKLSPTQKEIDAATNIQRMFRGYRVRLLLKQQTPQRKEFKAYSEYLKKVCDLVFAPAKREIEVGRIIRKVVQNNPKLFVTFKFYEDITNVFDVKEFPGKIPNVEPHAWVPITRFIIAFHGDTPVPCAFYFSSNLQQFVIQGIDNDTNEELFRLTNSISPHYYRKNKKGFTIFIFGWNDANTKTVNWRLEMVTMRYFQGVHLCNTLMNFECCPYSIPNLEVIEVKNYYIPNRRSRICRCLIKIQKRSLLTLRLYTSYSEVQFVMTLSLDKKFHAVESEGHSPDKILIRKQSSNGALLLNSFILEHYEPEVWFADANPDDPTVYILEAYVVSNSWPLTKKEWEVVEPFRTNGENWKESSISVFSKRDSKRRMTRLTSKRSSSESRIDNPFWSLKVLNNISDTPESDSIVVEEDKTYSESIRAMKISWEEKDPGRRKRGRLLRLNFLKEIDSESYKKYTDDSDSFYGEVDDEDVTLRSIRSSLGKKSTFSYLAVESSMMRFFKSPRILPRMPTTELLNKHKIQEESFTMQSGYMYDDSSDLSESNATPNVDMDDLQKEFLNRCRYFRIVLSDYLGREQALTQLLMERAYEKRLRAIERLSR